MKTITTKGDRILWLFLAAVLFIYGIKIANAQPNTTDVLKVKITGNVYSDETFVRFKAGASEGFEWDNDALKMFSMNPTVPMIFTKIDGYAVCLNTFPALDKKVKMDLFTGITIPGNYTIETKIVSPFSSSVKIFLIDKLANEIYDVFADSVITVTLSVDSGNVPRFQLYFSTPAQYSVSNLTCFKNVDGKIILNNLSDYGWQIDIVDENNIFHKSDSGTTETFSVSNLHGGKYTMNINSFSNISETFLIVVEQPYPVISLFELSNENVYLCDGGKMDFYNYSIGANSYEWNFGDSAKSSQYQPQHKYIAEGEYIVSLAVANGQCYDTAYKAISVMENYPMTVKDVGIKEEINIYYDGDGFVLRNIPIIIGTENITVDVFNLLGQKVYSNIYSDIFSNQSDNYRIKIKLLGKENQPYIFSVQSGESFSWSTKVVGW